jgi:hypothetical protein
MTGSGCDIVGMKKQKNIEGEAKAEIIISKKEEQNRNVFIVREAIRQ